MGETFLLSFGVLLEIARLVCTPILIIIGLFCVSCWLSGECAFLWGEYVGPPGSLPSGTLPTKISFWHSPLFASSGNYRICVIDTDSSVTTLWENSDPYFYLTWSPDGSKIMFKTILEPWKGCVVNSDGSQVVQLPARIDWLPEWSPDSRKLLGVSSQTYYRRDLDCVGGDIYAVNSDGTGLVKLTTRSACYDDVRWSSDGKRIAFSVSEANRPHDDATYVMPASGLPVGAQAIRLTNRPLHKVIDLQWSPDGSRIAILHTLGQKEHQWFRVGLLVVRSDGGGDICAKPVVSSHAYEGRFAWSPNGDHIAFAYEHHDAGQALVSVCIMDASCTEVISSGLSSVAVIGFGTWPDFAWSPDSNKLAFTNNPDLEHGSRYEAPWEIWVMNRDGSGLTRLSAGDDRWPAWSPNGAKIAFIRRREVYVMNADGSQQTRVTFGPGSVSDFSWAPR